MLVALLLRRAESLSFVQGTQSQRGSPRVSLVGSQSLSVSVQTDSPSQVYAVLLLAGDEEPSQERIIACTDAACNHPLACKQVSTRDNHVDISISNVPYEECGKTVVERYHGPDIPGIIGLSDDFLYGLRTDLDPHDITTNSSTTTIKTIEGLFYGQVLREYMVPLPRSSGPICSACPSIQPSTAYALYVVASDGTNVSLVSRVGFITANSTGLVPAEAALVFTQKAPTVLSSSKFNMTVSLAHSPSGLPLGGRTGIIFLIRWKAVGRQMLQGSPLMTTTGMGMVIVMTVRRREQ